MYASNQVQSFGSFSCRIFAERSRVDVSRMYMYVAIKNS